jgi:hypothetical protein
VSVIVDPIIGTWRGKPISISSGARLCEWTCDLSLAQRVGNGFSPFPPFYKSGKNVSFGNESVRVLAYTHQEEFGEACEIFESESAFTK